MELSETAWQDRRVLVTGATGLVGSWLTKKLVERGARVVALIRHADPQSELVRSGTYSRVSAISGRLEDFHTCERAVVEHGVDTVFHLGAQTIVGSAYRSPRNTFEANIRGSYNLFEACRIHSSQVTAIVLASSDKAYGECEHLPYDESLPLAGKHPYDVSKSCTDLIASSYFHTYDLPIIVARCGNIYGGGDLNWSRIVPGTIQSLYRGEAPVIRSDGKFLRDYVYVDDAADAYLRFGEAIVQEPAKFAGEAFNFGPSNPLNVLQIVETISDLMDRREFVPIIKNGAKAEIRDQFLNSQKALRELGLTPKTELEVGLRRTIEWYTDYFGSLT